jgi:hypothetical protein
MAWKFSTTSTPVKCTCNFDNMKYSLDFKLKTGNRQENTISEFVDTLTCWPLTALAAHPG